MANREQLELLLYDISFWNKWRNDYPEIRPNLRKARLRRINLSYANLSGANLYRVNFHDVNLNFSDLKGAILNDAIVKGSSFKGVDLRNAHLNGVDFSGIDLTNSNLNQVKLNAANLSGANLQRADLRGANLCDANLYEANLCEADLRGANFQRANLTKSNIQKAKLNNAKLIEADLKGADLSQVDLSEADLSKAILIETNLEKANLTKCAIYGISAWELNLTECIQKELVISRENQPHITVDNLEVAQFIYLLLHNEKIRNVIDTITSKVVLILGRFTSEHKYILDTMREELRKYNYLPILFDFEKPASKSLIDTIGTLAHLARFVIVDITDPKIVLEEVPYIVRNILVPVKPILLAGKEEVSTVSDLRRSHNLLLSTHQYKDYNDLLESFAKSIIKPAEEKAGELRKY